MTQKKTRYPISITDVTQDYEFYEEILISYKESKKYLLEWPWCGEIYSAELYFNMGSTLCIFLFNINNKQSSDDDRIWTIIGDLPIMYLDAFGAKSIKEVLTNYIELSSDWINAILKRKSVEKCFPFNTIPTKENALLLKSRIEFIKNTILENIDDVEIQD